MATRQLDKGLLEAARQGDGAALENLLVLCRPDLRRYAALSCLTFSDAEDAVQESLIIIYRKVSGLRSIATFSQWIFQIVRRECLRRIRPAHVDIEAVAEDAYLAQHSDVDLRLDITMAIQSLPDIYREVIILRDFEELTISEIADRLNLVPETVKTRIYRGRQLVREHLLT
jgi:RNA polymerase sigma factor (sigma-70 family)